MQLILRNYLHNQVTKQIKFKTYKNKLEEYNKLHPEMEAIYTGSSNGQFIQSPAIQMPDGYNPTERDWYKEAVKKKAEK